MPTFFFPFQSTCEKNVTLLLLRLLEQIVRNTPDVTPVKGEQFCTRHVKDLPSVEPFGCVIGSVSLDEMRPDFFLVLGHVLQPVLELSFVSMGFKCHRVGC